MALFFIAELALTVAFKLSTWCLRKTCDGIMYLVKRRSNKHIDPDKDNDNDNDKDIDPDKDNDKDNDPDKDNDNDFVVISRQEYCSLKKSHALHQLHHASASASEEASEEEEAFPASTSK